ncbi:hypothetical protein V1264_012353 [Littorina saxatilis]|uniref:Uncharacterized protein n=1 Tax=Littorina saxatilis TaxID=31220 RepID=A0AAN9GLV5_9CAEN
MSDQQAGGLEGVSSSQRLSSREQSGSPNYRYAQRSGHTGKFTRNNPDAPKQRSHKRKGSAPPSLPESGGDRTTVSGKTDRSRKRTKVSRPAPGDLSQRQVLESMFSAELNRANKYLTGPGTRDGAHGLSDPNPLGAGNDGAPSTVQPGESTADSALRDYIGVREDALTSPPPGFAFLPIASPGAALNVSGPSPLKVCPGGKHDEVSGCSLACVQDDASPTMEEAPFTQYAGQHAAFSRGTDLERPAAGLAHTENGGTPFVPGAERLPSSIAGRATDGHVVLPPGINARVDVRSAHGETLARSPRSGGGAAPSSHARQAKPGTGERAVATLDERTYPLRVAFGTHGPGTTHVERHGSSLKPSSRVLSASLGLGGPSPTGYGPRTETSYGTGLSDSGAGFRGGEQAWDRRPASTFRISGHRIEPTSGGYSDEQHPSSSQREPVSSLAQTAPISQERLAVLLKLVDELKETEYLDQHTTSSGPAPSALQHPDPSFSHGQPLSETGAPRNLPTQGQVLGQYVESH